MAEAAHSQSPSLAKYIYQKNLIPAAINILGIVMPTGYGKGGKDLN